MSENQHQEMIRYIEYLPFTESQTLYLLDRLFSEGKDEGDTFKLYII